jgi:hypothetical protein
MPTVKGIRGPYRFFFSSFDCAEQKHVHIQREKMICKFWLEPIVLAKNHSFGPKELNIIRGIIKNNKGKIMEAWYEHCCENSRSKN